MATSKAALPTVGEPMYATQLATFAKSTAVKLTDLRDAADKAAEACGSLELDGALRQLKALEDDLAAIEEAADKGQLVPLPGETVSHM